MTARVAVRLLTLVAMALSLLSVAVICGLTGVAAPALADGHHHPLHKDFYRYWKQPGTNVSCCNARIERDGVEVGDCEPTRAEIRSGVWWAWVRQERRWIEVPDAKLVREPNPNGVDAHLCWTPSQGVICFRPPDTGG